MASIIEKLEVQFQDQIKIGKLDIDENCGLVSRYTLNELPLILIIKSGQVFGHVVGAVSKNVLEEQLRSVLGKRSYENTLNFTEIDDHLFSDYDHSICTELDI